MLKSKCQNLLLCNYTFSHNGKVYITFDINGEWSSCYPTINNPGYEATNLCGSGDVAAGSIRIDWKSQNDIDYIAVEINAPCNGIDQFTFTDVTH